MAASEKLSGDSEKTSHKSDHREDAEVHIAGNSALDLPLRYVGKDWGNAEDAWGASNVQFLSQPVEPILGGGGAATAYTLGKLGSRVSLNTQVGEDP